MKWTGHLKTSSEERNVSGNYPNPQAHAYSPSPEANAGLVEVEVFHLYVSFTLKPNLNP